MPHYLSLYIENVSLLKQYISKYQKCKKVLKKKKMLEVGISEHFSKISS